jgi:hypothetical protein
MGIIRSQPLSREIVFRSSGTSSCGVAADSEAPAQLMTSTKESYWLFLDLRPVVSKTKSFINR